MIEELRPDTAQYKRIKSDVLSTIFHTNKLDLFKIGSIYEIFNPRLQKKVIEMCMGGKVLSGATISQ